MSTNQNAGYAEDAVFTIPVPVGLEAGLGSLFNCHSWKFTMNGNAVANLLTPDIDLVENIHVQQLEVDPIFTMTLIQSVEDKVRLLELDDSVVLEELLDIGYRSRQAKFNPSSSIREKSSSIEHYAWYFRDDCCRIDINEQKIAAILNKQSGSAKPVFGVTHVVCGLVTGSEVMMETTVRSKNGAKYYPNLHLGAADVGNISYWRRLDDDTNAAVSFSLDICLPNADTGIKSVSDALALIDDVHCKHERSIYLNEPIRGVPTRLVLVPVSRILRAAAHVQHLYKRLSPTSLENYISMVVSALDLTSQNEYTMRLLRSLIPRLECSAGHHIDDHVDAYREIEVLLRDLFNQYKKGTADNIPIAESSFASSSCAMKQILDAVEKWQTVADNGHATMSMSSSSPSRYFTDRTALHLWLDTGKNMKLLLETKCDRVGMEHDFRNFCKMMAFCDVDIGIASPAVSNKYAVTIYGTDNPISYVDDKVSAVLHVLLSSVGGMGCTNALFYSVCASTLKMTLPLTFHDAPAVQRYIEHLQIFQGNVHIAKSHCDVIDQLYNCKSRWAFFIPFGHLDNVLDAVDNMRTLMKNHYLVGVRWILGDLHFPEIHDAPFIIVLSSMNIKAICCDNLDLATLVHLFRKGDSYDFSPLALNSRASIYPERARYADNFSAMIRQVSTCSSNFQLKSFTQILQPTVSNALAIQRCVLQRRLSKYITTLATIADNAISGVVKALGDLCKFPKSVRIVENQMTLIAIALHDLLTAENKTVGNYYLVFENALDLLNHSCSFGVTWLKLKCQLETLSTDLGIEEDFIVILTSETCQAVENSYQHVVDVLKRHKPKSDEACFLVEIVCLVRYMLRQNMILLSTSNVGDKLVKYLLESNKGPRDEAESMTEIDEFISNSQPFHVLKHLSRMSLNKQLSELHTIMERVCDISNADQTIGILQQLQYVKFTDSQKHDLQQHLHLSIALQEIIGNENSVHTFCDILESTSELRHMLPTDIVGKLQNEHKSMLAIEHKFEKLSDVKRALHKTIRNIEMWEDFMKALETSCKDNFQLKESLRKADALENWNGSTFTANWGEQTMLSVLEKIDRYLAITDMYSGGIEAGKDEFESWFMGTVAGESKPSGMGKCVDETAKWENGQSLKVHRIYRTTQADYYKISFIRDRPVISSDSQLSECTKLVLAYIIQRVKMRGCNVLQASRVSSFVNIPVAVVAPVKNTPSFGKKAAKLSTVNSSSSQNAPVSRLDCVNSLVHSLDDIVANDLLTVMSAFPMSLPLIIPDEDTSRYCLLTSLLAGIVVKWENTSGSIIENSLFRDAFRLLVGVRLGNNTIGKSAILNGVFSRKNIFSSRGEPGWEYGKPRTLNGTVEFVWLTQELCEDALWKNEIQHIYASGRNEIILLANLHGDATDFIGTCKVLSQLNCWFLVFVMPDCNEAKWEEFNDHVEGTRVSFLSVDPLDYEEDDTVAIQTCHLSADTTLKKVRTFLGNGARKCSEFVGLIDIFSLSMFDGIFAKPMMSTSESQELIKLVEALGVKNAKKSMHLQTIRSDRNRQDTTFNKSTDLKRLMGHFVKLLRSPKDRTSIGLIHVEKELSRLSNLDSKSARAVVAERKAELRRTLGIANERNPQVQRIKQQLIEAMKMVDCSSLGLEHFFRELGQLYEMALNKKIKTGKSSQMLEISQQVADLFISGHAIELLDGDAGDIPISWLRAICEDVTKRVKKLRLFVVSILGLQSGGKSTLLNSLFACRFSVSVGRCSRGLFMRLLFLEDDVMKKYDFDAVLLIDTEGLGSPEKMNDPESDKKDRLLATFAMGISSLTLINVLGENMKELTEILQIAIVAMARLEKADISPDILMVQHLLTEKNADKTCEAQDQFCESIRKAIDLADTQDSQLGIRNSKCLSTLFERIQNGTLLIQFHPFKDGATVNSPPSESYHEDVVALYNKILESSLASRMKTDFEAWHNLVESYWECLQTEDFSLRFKNVKEIYEFIERSQKVDEVKQSIDDLFRCHSRNVEQLIVEAIRKSDVKAKDDSGLHCKVAEAIKGYMAYLQMSCAFAESLFVAPRTENVCEKCRNASEKVRVLYDYIKGRSCETDTKSTVMLYRKRLGQQCTKKLVQFFDAEVMQGDCSTKFADEITRYLKEVFTRRVAGNFSDNERKAIFNIIFQNLLRIAAEMNRDVPLRDKVLAELRDEYSAYADFVNVFLQSVTKDSLKDIEAFDLSLLQKTTLRRKRLNDHEINAIKEEIEMLPAAVMLSMNIACFEPGIVRLMKKNIDLMMERFSQNLNEKRLSNNFKTHVHVLAQQHFFKHLEGRQREWDKNHHPLKILESKRDYYRKEIYARLDYGFSCRSEGKIIAQLLFASIEKDAKETGNNVRLETVGELKWMKNSSQVRLQYFKELAEEIRHGNKIPARLHFRSPTASIDKWFINRVDEFLSDAWIDAYNSKLDRKFDTVLESVRSTKDVASLLDLIKEHAQYRSETDLSKCDHRDFLILQKQIDECLLDNKHRLPAATHKIFSLPSDEKSIMNRLGCTERCPWCGALCWLHRDHHNDTGNNKELQHFTSHQPCGLNGTHYVQTLHLQPRTCHKHSDTDPIIYYLSGERTEMKWGQAKQTVFKDWRFDSFHNTKFDELMRWFFQELHNDLAADHELKPAKGDEMIAHGCVGLSYDSIMERVQLAIDKGI